MTTIAIVNPAEWMPKVADLLEANWAETGFDFPFSPDIDAYQRMFDAGVIFAVAAMDRDRVVGYCTVVVVPHMHNPSVVVASNDALFVVPEYRHGLVAGRLIVAAEAEAKRRGAQRFTWHCRAGTNLSDMLCKHGYMPVDNVVMKGL